MPKEGRVEIVSPEVQNTGARSQTLRFFQPHFKTSSTEDKNAVQMVICTLGEGFYSTVVFIKSYRGFQSNVIL